MFYLLTYLVTYFITLYDCLRPSRLSSQTTTEAGSSMLYGCFLNFRFLPYF